jgi:hypothetical protein
MNPRTKLILLTLWAALVSSAVAADKVIPASLKALTKSGTAIVALTGTGHLQRSTDGGTIFITTRTATADALVNLNASGSTVVAVGDAGFAVRSLNAGQTWANATSPAFLGELRDVAGKGGGFWVAVGRKDLNVTALWSADDGASWTIGTLPTQTGTLNAVAYDTTAARWTAVGTDGLLGARIATSVDGKTWTAVTPPAGTQPLLDVATDGQGNALAVGEAGTMLVSANAGQTFTAATGSGTLVSENLTAVIPSATTGWLIGGDEKVQLSFTSGGTATVTQSPVAGAGAITSLALNAGNDLLVAGPYTPATPAPIPGRLFNLSIRTAAGAGSGTLIVGFVTSAGTDGASLLVRAAGPALLPYGVTGVLANPALSVNNSVPVVVQSNDDWNAALSSTFLHVGASPWTAGSKDSAVALELAPGLYSAVITGADGGSGIALGEIYDLNAAGVATKARLVNVSARSQVGTGADIMIAGFVIIGDTPVRVLIRGVGPTLATQGVTGVLADPQLAVFQGSTQIGGNNDWAPALAATFAQVGAAALQAGSKDAALVLDLSPGVYSAQVSGVGGTTGVALVEIYAVPTP